MYGPNPLILRENLEVETFFLIVRHCARGRGLWWKCVSAFPIHFYVGIFSVSLCVQVTQLVTSYLSEGIDPCVAVYSVCPWESQKSPISPSWWCHSRFLQLFFLKPCKESPSRNKLRKRLKKHCKQHSWAPITLSYL